ncbi:MAG: hypothetical protein B6244_08180 [Candidatus Cloacimonetes bacterium 4572_55]|nr:MAG: hypothetical protein B6244_08180 [Candidatus Cloacimonetes bacterium 4572_55]
MIKTRFFLMIFALFLCFVCPAYGQGGDGDLPLSVYGPILSGLHIPNFQDPDSDTEDLRVFGDGHPLARDRFGNLHLIYSDLLFTPNDTLIAVYYMVFNPEEIPPDFEPVLLDSFSWFGVAPDPSIQIDNQDNIHLLWLSQEEEEDGEIVFGIIYFGGKYNPNSENWDWIPEPIILLDSEDDNSGINSEARNLSFTFYREGDVYHFYCVNSSNFFSDIGVVICFRVGFRLTDQVEILYREGTPISAIFSSSIQPKIALDSRGYPHVVWTDSQFGNYEIVRRRGPRHDEPFVWSDPVRNVSESSAGSAFPKLSIDSNDVAHIIWSEFDSPGNFSPSLKYRTLDILRDEASSIYTMQEGGYFSHDSDHQIAISGRGDVHAIWISFDIQSDGASLIFYNRHEYGTGWQVTWNPILSDILDPDYIDSGVVTRADAHDEFDFVWLRQHRENPDSNFIMYGNITFNDSPNNPDKIEFTVLINDPIPTISDSLNVEELSWCYEDVEGDSMQFFHVQISDDSSFQSSQSQYNYIGASEPASPSGEIARIVDFMDELPSVASDGIYYIQIRAADGFRYDQLGELNFNWGPWSRERIEFRIDNSSPSDLLLTIGNRQLGTQDATVTYDREVDLYLSATDSSSYSVRLWGMEGYRTRDQALRIEATDQLAATLPSGDGVKRVYAQCEDALGHLSLIMSDSILLDQHHIVYPDRDNCIYLPEFWDDHIPNNDTRLCIPAGSVSDTLIITPLTTEKLSEESEYLNSDNITSVSDHPRIDSEIVGSIRFTVRNKTTHELIHNLRFQTADDPGESVELFFHYDSLSLVEGDVDEDQADDLKIFYWDGINWVYLGGLSYPDKNYVLIKSLEFLPSSPPPGPMPQPNLNSESPSPYLPDFGLFKVESGFLDPLSKLSVRPNPFTPNEDGYNDLLYFDFGINPAFDATSGPLTIKIFDERGYQIRTLRDGSYPIIWDGTDNQERPVEGGLYFYQVQVHDRFHSGSVALIR